MNIKLWILFAATCAGIVLSSFMRAQDAPTYKVDVRVVNVLATVRDHSGRIVNDLTEDDFILEEDGKQQEIQYFSRQTDLPLTVGLLIDTSRSQRTLIEDERSASYQFLNQVLRPDRDKAFVIKFDFDAELMQDITNSRDALQKALNALKAAAERPRASNSTENPNWPGVIFSQNWPDEVPFPGGHRYPGRDGRRGGPYPGGQRRVQGGGTVLYDSVFLASDEILQPQEGRKAIILISDGVDQGSKVSAREATDAAHRADTIVYSIRYFDSSAYSGSFGGTRGRDEGSVGTNVLKVLSQETGGRMYEVSRKLPLKGIFDRIEEELRNQYSIGYTPSDTKGTGFRQIKLRTKDSKLEVVTRAGYYPKDK